jgi:hypothetical protein
MVQKYLFYGIAPNKSIVNVKKIDILFYCFKFLYKLELGGRINEIASFIDLLTKNM